MEHLETMVDRRPMPPLSAAPLVPVAIAVTAGILLNRYDILASSACVAVAAISLLVWGFAVWQKGPALIACVALWCASAALGGLMNHWHGLSSSDQGSGQVRPGESSIVRVRGTIASEIEINQPNNDPLRANRPELSSRAEMFVSEIRTANGWQTAAFRVHLIVGDEIRNIQPGDEIEVVAQLQPVPTPGNPGEHNLNQQMRDNGIAAYLRVQHSASAISKRKPGLRLSTASIRAAVREWGREVIGQYLPKDQQDVARALLLGEQTALEQVQWDRFQQTGVIHVLAVSGQHLVVLAFFLTFLLRISHASHRFRAVILVGLIFAYVIISGQRPPVVRAAMMIALYSFAIYFQRQPVGPNIYAFAWLAVLLLNPGAISNVGVQLSFLAVAVIFWGTTWVEHSEVDRTRVLELKQWPVWKQILRTMLFWFAAFGVVNALVWLCLTPLIALRVNIVSPIALLIGPPIVLLISLALITGFLMLISAAVLWPLAPVFAFATQICLSLCLWMIDWAEKIPGAYWYVPSPPTWWVIGFYIFLLTGITLQLLRRYWLGVVYALIGWLCIGLIIGLLPAKRDPLRCTFLAVGHGSCVVLQDETGRTLLYDAGAITGPDVTRRQIAPFLWSQGIRRIDEVILSHADLDHFNGLPALAERFAIGQVTYTPSFKSRQNPAVELTIKALERFSIPQRIIDQGKSLTIGDIQLHALHPPSNGPPGIENVRSLVLLVTFKDHSILLTGDLEGVGLQRVLNLPPIKVDVLMAPHHGSAAANVDPLATWASPSVVVSCQGPPNVGSEVAQMYEKHGARFLTTWEHGAVSFIVRDGKFWMETFRTGERWEIP